MSARQVTANPALAVTGGSTATPSGSTTFTPTVSGTPNLFSGVQTTTAATPRFSFGGSSRTRIFSSTWQDATVKANSKRSGRPMTRHEEHSEPQTQTVELPATSLRRNLTSAPIFGDTSFTVFVGPEGEAKRFSLHKSLAVNESGFFESTFRNVWKESRENVIRLPDHEAEAFEVFFLFLYTRRIFSAQTSSGFANEGSSEWYLLAHAWALGSYLQATDFQDAIADAVVEKASLRSTTMHDIHKIIYANSTVGTPIRKLLVDLAVWKWDVKALEAQSNDASWSDFFRDLSVALLKTRGSTEESRIVTTSCEYHEHCLKGATCYRLKRNGLS